MQKQTFKQYIVNIDLTELNDTDIDRENDLSNQNMFNIRRVVCRNRFALQGITLKT